MINSQNSGNLPNPAPQPFQDSGLIPTRSKQQALDWSLVLASQNIACSILPPDPETSRGFALSVPRTHYSQAVRALRQFHLENKPQPWRHTVPGTRMIFDIRAAAWISIWILLFVLEHRGLSQLRTDGLMDTQLFADGQWWRAFTAVTLHGDMPHLTANVTSGLVLLGLALGSFGWGWGILAAYLSGVIGNLSGWMIYPDLHRSLGASGMVMGALGLLTVDALAYARRTGQTKSLAWRGLFGGSMLLVLLGMNPDSDVVAHVGGFLGGIAFGWALSFLPESILWHKACNYLLEILVAVLIILTWWLAVQ